MPRKESTLPESVKIGAATYAIAAMDPVHAVETGHKGETVFDAQTIALDMRWPGSVVARTLLRGIFHAIRNEWGVKEGDNDERQVIGMESGMAAVMVDSPEVIHWIMERLS